MPADVVTAVETVRARQADLVRAEQYYEGDVAEVFASWKLARLLQNTGRDFPFNFARTVVDSVLDRLEITGRTVPQAAQEESPSDDRSVGGTQGSAADPLIAALDSVWDWNQLDLEADEFHRWSMVYGDGYALVWPSNEPGEVEITWQSPRTMHLFYDSESPRKKSFAAKVWTQRDERTGKDFTRVNLYYADRLEKWATRPGVEGKQAADFAPWYDQMFFAGDDELPAGAVDLGDGTYAIWPIINPYGQVPVFHFRSQRPYGRPEHKDAYGAQNALTKIIVDLMATMDHSAFPQRYEIAGNNLATGEAADFAMTEDEVALAQADARARADDSDYTSSPGTLWKFAAGSEVGQFEVAQASAFLEPLAKLIEVMAALTHTPVHRFTGMSGAPSGESLRAADAPLTRKVQKRQASFGATWVQILQFALLVLAADAERQQREGEMASVTPLPGAAFGEETAELERRLFPTGLPDITLSWQPAFIGDDIDTAEKVVKWDQAGAASLYTKVREIHPGWREDQIQEEIERIENEETRRLEANAPDDEPPAWAQQLTAAVQPPPPPTEEEPEEPEEPEAAAS